MRIYKYLPAFITFMVLFGCNKEFLELERPDAITIDNFYKTEADAIAAVNAAYQPLQRPKLYGLRMWALDIMAGNSEVGADPTSATDGIETKDQARFITQANNAGVLDIWRGPAPGILYSNLVIQRVPAIEMNEDLKNRIIGEAKFLRAYYYFILVRLYGDVPLILEPQDATSDLRPARTPAAQVYEQIIKDLTEAAEQLPARETYADADKGRASKGSALGMLAKVYLTLGQWEKTVELCDQVTALGYQLNPMYGDNFSVTNENSIESLFEVQYIAPSKVGLFDDANNSSLASNFMGPRNAPDFVGVGWGWNQPTQEFVDSYEENDARKDVTIFYEGGPQFDGKDYKSSYAFVTGYNVRKFVLPKSIVPNADAGSPLNFPVLRYADVLLMKAEALNELGKAAEAVNPLKEVRDRAGLETPSAWASSSKDEFREKVLHERRMELAFEGQRWFDLIRVDDGRGKGQYALDFLHSIGRTNASLHHLLLPIPQAERDVNPNLTQNPGY